MNEEQLSFVSLIHQHWMTNGTLLTADLALAKYELPPKVFATHMATTAVKEALTERGIELKHFDLEPDSWQSRALTPKQLIMANIMLDLVDTRSNRKKLQDNGIDSKTWAAWLRDPVFRDYLDSRARNLLSDNAYEAQLALMDKVSSGDVKALELYFEMTGQFVRQRAGSTSELDLRNLLTRIVEIIIEEVDDPQVAATIADRIKSLGTAHSVAGNVVDTPIVQPQVAAAPELSPKLAKVLESGAGHNA